ncbi:HEPN domain-containing protein [Amycolatopsis sp. NPDC051045]|uniref:HEPN domain-containing protein n=1 Tax=Amycolatopsis sp. NPDC051045 TaxID=3156922 RepID=UPI003418728F
MIDNVADPVFDNMAGTFWLDEESPIAGTISSADGVFRVTLAGIARQPQSFPTRMGADWIAIDISGNPRDIVADYNPVPLLGTLSDGRIITLLDARLADVFPEPDRQTLEATRALVGARVPTAETKFRSARVTVPMPHQWGGIFAYTEPIEVDLHELKGELTSKLDGNFGWVKLSTIDHPGLVTEDWDRRFWNRILTLLRLWTDQNVSDGRRIQLSLEPGGPWAELINSRSSRSHFAPHQTLLKPHRLTLPLAAEALVAFESLAPVSDIASKHKLDKMTLESALLANASSLEGLHRRRGKTKPFPTLSNGQTEKIAKHAAVAAASKAIKLGALSNEHIESFTKRMRASFEHLNEPTFNERLNELLPPIESIAPGLIGHDRAKWISEVVSARNLEAHRFDKEIPNHLERNDNYYQLAVSTEWVLWIAVLLRLGVDQEELRAGLLQHQQFLFALANMDNCQFSWPGSRLKEFKKHPDQ